jgi:uncharacterized repeat protein (TIGR03803 family)
MRSAKFTTSFRMTPTLTLVLFLAAVPIVAAAQTLTTLVNFDGTNGSSPTSAPVQGLDGNFYGTATGGGTDSNGTVFKMTTAGTLTTLLDFDTANGASPNGLVLATNGNLYGTTGGNAINDGTVFAITTTGKLTTLYTFCQQGGSSCTDGLSPAAPVVQAANGDFYGTTFSGGDNQSGTVFEITPAGKLTTLYSFCADGSPCPDGDGPRAGLVQATNGNLYGTTSNGGADGGGTVFVISTAGKLITLYNFCTLANCADGRLPYGGLVQGANGNLYGTTRAGGANGQGTVFELTLEGKLATLYSFCSMTDCADGADPYGTLVLATDGNFYGTTTEFGISDCAAISGLCGTVFKITPKGKLTTLYSFCSKADCADGAYAYAGLVQGTDGTFYGTTIYGGTSNDGTVYSVSTGLGPFVETLPTSGAVGATIKILGNNLDGTTTVTFNGTAATFTMLSATEIKATVPAGATTGTVEVTTATGTLSSNVRFTVK